MGVRGACRWALVAAALLAHSAAFASSTGITGQSTAGCTLGGCHGDVPGSYNYTGSVQHFSGGVWTTASTTVARNAALSIRYYLSYNSGSVAGRGGFNMSANGGTLSEADGTIQNVGGELTHTTPRTLTGNDINFNNLTWTAPNSSGSFTVFACGQPVSFAGDGVNNDGPHRCDTLAITVNNPPTISDVANQTINEDGTTGALGFTVSDTETVATSLTVTRSSSNTTLVPLANVVLGGSGGSRTVTVTPAANQSGSSTITLTVTDGNGQTDTDTFLVTVNSVNDAPTLNAITNPAAINEDAGQQVVNLSGIGAGGGESQTLVVSASSNNTALIPNPAVTYTSPNATGSLSYTPVANANGSAVVTVTVTDSGGTANGGVNSTQRTFTVTVNSVNDAPTLNAIANPAAINEDAGQQVVNLSGIGAGGGESQTLVVSASSNNTALIPNPAVTYTSPNATGSLSYTPVANANGSAIVTVTVTDDGGTANGGVNSTQRTFTVTVNAANDPPTAVNDTPSVSKNSTNNSLDVLANDTDPDSGDSQSLVSVGTPSNGGAVVIGAPCAANRLCYTPATNFSGNESFAYTMQDGAGLQSSATVTVTVGTGVAPVANTDSATVLEDSLANVIDALANDTDADPGDTKEITQVNGSASFPVAVTGGSVALSGSGPDNTLLFTPAADFFGAASFNYTVRDAGLLTAVGTVNVTVTGINDAPTLNAIANPAAINEDAGLQGVSLSGISAGGGESQALTVTASSNNTALIPNPTVTYTSPNATGSLSYTPVANANGSAIVTVTVADSGGTANGGVNSTQRTFTVTVNSVNDAPTLNAITNPAAINEDAGQQVVNLSGIGAGGGESQTLVVSASSNNTALIPNPTVTYTSPNATGSLSYTPVPDANGSAIITVTVTDNGGTANGGVNTTQRTFTVTVNAVNDTPVVAAIPDQQVTDNALFSYTVAVADADGETSFAYGLTGAPAGMSIDSGGTITWTPPIGTAGVFTPTVEATDGSAATGTRTFQLTVSAPDSDNDGMPDSFENLHGLDPNDPGDAAQDADGDGVSNLDEYLGGTDPTRDDIPPAVTAPADRVVPSTGYLTVVDLGTATATDGRDGALTATSDLTSAALRPGRHFVTWTAQDVAGNTGSDTQQVDVLPLANFNADQASGEGRVVFVTVTLNGSPPQYPAAVPYTLGGTAGAADSDAVPGTLTIASGLSATLAVAITADGTAEGPEQLTFTMGAPSQAAAGARSMHTIAITDGNAAPVVALSAFQGAFPRGVAYQDDGTFTLDALASDPNDDALGYDWSGSADALGIDAAATAQAQFDPSGLAPGAYPVRVIVSDGQLQAAASRLVIVAVGSSTEVDIDGDGIPDSMDSVTDYGALLENQAGDPSTAELIETDPGLALRRGRTSLAAGRTGALIAMSDLVTFGVGEGGLALGADSYDNLGGLFDFEVHGLAPGGTARVVLPLQTAIREGAVYRKFNPATGWHDFVIDARNAVASAHSAFGQCPGPDSGAYVTGLQPFADCVRLTLTDGGPNDADGVADGVIRDPGGVAITNVSTEDTDSVSSGAWLALWLPLAALLRMRRRAGPALLALAVLLAVAPAHAEHHVRLHYSGDLASGFDNNVTNAQQDTDIRESGFASAGGHMDYQRQLSLYSTLLLRGSLQGEYWNSFEGLNNGKATAMARVLYRADGDFYTPTLAAWASAAVWEFDSEIRDSNEYRAGVFLTEHLTTQIDGRIALTASRRESEGLVFDLEGWSAQLNLDWAPAPRATVYTGYQYYDGGVTSTATPSLWIGLAAEAIEADDAFGGLAGGLRAYRLDAKAHIATLGFNYALTRKMSLDLQGQFISTRADARNEYERMVGVASLLARF